MNPTVSPPGPCGRRARTTTVACAWVLAAWALADTCAALDVEVIDARLTYVDTPGLTSVERSGSVTPTGAASPASDGERAPHERRGYSIEAGAFVGSALWPDDHAGLMLGVSLLDAVSGGTYSGGTAGPGGTAVTKEDLDAFAVKVHVGPYITYHALRLELLPFLAVGPSRGTFYANNPPATGAAAALSELFGSTTEVHSDIGTYLAYGAQLGLYFEPHVSGSFLIGGGAGYEGFRSRVHFSTNASTGGATDVLSGHGVDVFLSVGGRF